MPMEIEDKEKENGTESDTGDGADKLKRERYRGRERRSGAERRKGEERREEIRWEPEKEERRGGTDRRKHDAWDDKVW